MCKVKSHFVLSCLFWPGRTGSFADRQFWSFMSSEPPPSPDGPEGGIVSTLLT
ncbi:hypothetical protein RGUI_2639 [Rhodovulum sp. P5]|nr:hypothetical protein RGUI_2639 [Rhodovulum sp. P5]